MKKIIFDKNATIEFSAQTKEVIKQVKIDVQAIAKTTDNEGLLEYIRKNGTEVIRFKKAPILLRLLGEEEGLIVVQQGFKRLIFGALPVFVLRTGEINRLVLLHQFYKWYSMKKGLPGFDYASQKLFKKAMRSKNLEKMNINQVVGLREAVARDREATDWTYEHACAEDGTKKAFDKLNTGGANI